MADLWEHRIAESETSMPSPSRQEPGTPAPHEPRLHLVTGAGVLGAEATSRETAQEPSQPPVALVEAGASDPPGSGLHGLGLPESMAGTPPPVAPASTDLGASEAATSGPLSADDVQAASVKLWALYRLKQISFDELDRSLVALEVSGGLDTYICGSCRSRHATIKLTGLDVCATCANGRQS